ECLTSIDPNKVHSDAYGFVNKDAIPPEQLSDVQKMHELVAEGFSKDWPIDIAYFSDSLVLTAENSTACYLVLELVCKLMVRIWTDYGLLIRGGITIDRIVHIKNGPIFGPAMNNAYYLESKYAKHPRVIFDSKTIGTLKNVSNYSSMKKLFSEDGDYTSINLASAFDHLLNTSMIGANPISRNKLITAILETPKRLSKQISEFPDDDKKVRPKYVWIKEKIDILIANGRDSFLATSGK
ncbi:MAG: hypothetical protein JWQ09_4781, partial [Segetibacter sp.]|nr:hypothetical protein [Segetibacter sp.]